MTGNGWPDLTTNTTTVLVSEVAVGSPGLLKMKTWQSFLATCHWDMRLISEKFLVLTYLELHLL